MEMRAWCCSEWKNIILMRICDVSVCSALIWSPTCSSTVRGGHGGVLCASKQQVFVQACVKIRLGNPSSSLCVVFILFFFYSKTALLEGLEVDQYMWGILNAIQK